ncbi:Phosphopantetheine attachment site [Moraxella cuniculi DSM 21768]|uniref:Phosphopantetheine attachment site n=1 Tax=Moraxella cuniculi DSM 21768 TaxID=1122245 RepID=A0A1N7FVY1_9GAMM|nr:AMP-binding protein [Moraxella cuniculi]OOS03678.1 hypothetical protein B0189_09200 [Moraxella cuniculi]SIS04454.1 Phosphopantetheine attachment site [Moraxella cuniculi DSM 21768]
MDNLFGLFVKVAQNNRDVAIESPMQHISYEKLLQLSHIYYQYLTTIPTQRIAIHCDALLTVEMIAMMFAIFAHKKSCVLLDAARSEEFNQKILSQIDCKKVVNQKDLLDIKKNQSTISLCANIEQPINPKDEGYVVTTSGSTGEPKIILGSHAGLVHFICWQKKRYFNEVKYRVAHTTNCAFDVIYREIFTTLISGSTLVIPNIDLKYQSGECLTKWLKTKQINVLYGVPSVFDFWLNTMRLGQSKLPLAKVFFAGEKLQKSTVYHLQQYFVVDCLVNLYGPSETTLAKFYYDSDLAQIENYDAIPVGRALPDTEFVLDDQNQILIHTKYPSLGYLGYDNFVWQDGKQWYPTGDIGEIKDGLLFVQGRVDDQIKVNGVRVHLSDVNTHLAAIEGVTQSVVLQDCRSKIIGFYTGSLQKSLVYDQLKNKLYQPILPNQIYHLEQMPRTASGKIDRQALLSYANQQTIDVQDDDILYQIWRKVTGYQGAITRNDSFFELGGDSLDIAYFAIELERATGKKIDYWSVYEHPVIQDFCHWLNQQPKHTSEDAQLFQDAQSFDVPIVSYPFTPQQKRYKNIYMPMYNRNWCNMLVLWDFSRVDIQQLQDALIAVIARHDALQSIVLMKKCIWCQRMYIKIIK